MMGGCDSRFKRSVSQSKPFVIFFKTGEKRHFSTLPFQLNTQNIGHIAPLQSPIHVVFHANTERSKVLWDERSRATDHHFCP